jgi:hypothetical protein
LREECKAESQKLSQPSDSFNTQHETINKLQADNKVFQSRTEENLHVIMEVLAIKAPGHDHGRTLVQGETSGGNNPLIPPTTGGGGVFPGSNGGENSPLIPPTTGGEGVFPRSNGSLIPIAIDGAGSNHKSINLDFPKFDGNDPTNWVLKAQHFFAYGQIPDI